MMKATFRALATLARPKPTDWVPTPPSFDELSNFLGPNFAKALEKRPWMAFELARLHKEGADIMETDE